MTARDYAIQCIKDEAQAVMGLISQIDDSFDEAVELIKRDTRRFAKRQISWFKRDKRIRWFAADELGEELPQKIMEYFMTGE